MGTVLALAVYGVLLAAASALVWRRPARALLLFVVGLAAHNAAMAALYGAGVRGGALTAIQAWKEVLLVVALARLGLDARRARRLPFRPGLVDWLALAFATLVVVYAVVPQGRLGGEAGGTAVLYGLRHDLVPVAAFLVGRSLRLGAADLRRLRWLLIGTAAAVAALGLVEEYLVPLRWWRDAGVPGYFNDQLGFDYRGVGRLPENFVFNTGSETRLSRRLVSVFLSPLATSYLLVVALLVASSVTALRRRVRLLAGLAAISAVGLLFTYSRASIIALAAGLLALAVARRRAWPVPVAALVLAAGVGFALAFTSVAPRTHFFPEDLPYQRQQARLHGGKIGAGTEEPSIRSHLTSLRAGLRTVVHHPQGYGLGNAGETASRFDVKLQAGESTYTELGVETGLGGMLLFLAWNLALLAGLVGRGVRSDWAAGLAAALAAVLTLAVQTDVLGVSWLALCLWPLAGALLDPPSGTPAASGPTREPAATEP